MFTIAIILLTIAAISFLIYTYKLNNKLKEKESFVSKIYKANRQCIEELNISKSIAEQSLKEKKELRRFEERYNNLVSLLSKMDTKEILESIHKPYIKAETRNKLEKFLIKYYEQ